MKAIWTETKPEYHGKLVDFGTIMTWPKPVQKPHPPVLLGGHGPKALARVVDYADGWLPIGVRAGDLAAGIAELRRLAKEKGRDPSAFTVSVYGVPLDPDGIRQLGDAGVTRAIFALPSAPAEKVLSILDRCTQVMKAIRH